MRTRRRGLGAALRAYVEGHDRGWDADRKLRASAGADPQEPDIAWSAEPESPRFGVGVPDELDFHRGPDTWRGGADGGA